MKKLIIVLATFGLIGLCSFSSTTNMRAPDCDACYKQDGWSDPAEPWDMKNATHWQKTIVVILTYVDLVPGIVSGIRVMFGSRVAGKDHLHLSKKTLLGD